MVFDFTPKAVMQIELRTGEPITTALSTYSVTNIMLFVECGLGVSEKEAQDAVGKYLKEGGELHKLYLSIVEGLQAQGFLPKTLNLQQAEAELEAKMTTPIAPTVN